MLTGSRQFDTIETQIQCPPLLHQQFKTVALKAWDRITPQAEPAVSYTKILQGPNKSYTNILARLETAISRTVIREETKEQLEKSLAYENEIRNIKELSLQFMRLGLLLIFEGFSPSRIRNSKDANAS